MTSLATVKQPKKQPKAVAKKKKTTISSISIDGTSNLVVEKKIISEDTDTFECKTDTYPLTEVTKEELFQLRVSGKPGFVLKKDNSYFYTEIPRTLSLVSNDILGKHKCPDCKNFFSSTDVCPKVKDPSFSWFTRRLPSSKEEIPKFIAHAVEESSRIEKFPFITQGYETFNCPAEAFVVIRCSCYGSFSMPKTKNSYY